MDNCKLVDDLGADCTLIIGMPLTKKVFHSMFSFRTMNVISHFFTMDSIYHDPGWRYKIPGFAIEYPIASVVNWIFSPLMTGNIGKRPVLK